MFLSKLTFTSVYWVGLKVCSFHKVVWNNLNKLGQPQYFRAYRAHYFLSSLHLFCKEDFKLFSLISLVWLGVCVSV